MKIELLVFDGCPNHEPAEKLVRETVEELGVDANIEVIKVQDHDDAIAKAFLGSPSIRINGRDIELEENELTQYSMRCRVYRSEESYAGVPSKALLLSAITEAAGLK
jgi:hypothetical protein